MQEQRTRLRSSNPAERFAAALLLPAELAKRLSTLSNFQLGQLLGKVRFARHSGESKYAIHSGIREGGCGWQVLPADAPDLEEAALRACELMSPGILESARGRGRRGGLEVGDQEGAEIVEAGEGIHSPAKGRARS